MSIINLSSIFFFVKVSSIVKLSSSCRQGIVKLSSVVNRQSSVVNRQSSTHVRACVCACVRLGACLGLGARVCVCVCVCGSRIHARKDLYFYFLKIFFKVFEKKFCNSKNVCSFASNKQTETI